MNGGPRSIPPSVDLALQLFGGMMSLTFMLVRFVFPMTFMAFRVR